MIDADASHVPCIGDLVAFLCPEEPHHEDTGILGIVTGATHVDVFNTMCVTVLWVDNQTDAEPIKNLQIISKKGLTSP